MPESEKNKILLFLNKIESTVNTKNSSKKMEASQKVKGFFVVVLFFNFFIEIRIFHFTLGRA